MATFVLWMHFVLCTLSVPYSIAKEKHGEACYACLLAFLTALGLLL